MKGNTIGWKMTFRKSKLIDNRPILALNFRRNVETHCSYCQNPMFCRWLLNSLLEEDQQRMKIAFSLGRDNCCLCVKFGSQGFIIIGTENLFQPSKQMGSFDVILVKLYVWKWWIANRVLRAMDRSDRVSSCFVEGKSEPFIMCIRLCQRALFSSENEKSETEERDSSAAFQRWFLCPIEFHWVEKFRNMYVTV